MLSYSATAMNMPARESHNLLLLDGIAPFFRGYSKKRVNWSKVPFRHLETENRLKTGRRNRIVEDFTGVCDRAAELGFTGITLDDVAHLAPWQGYPAALQSKIQAYRDFYRELFAVSADRGLRVYLTTDIMYYTPELERRLGRRVPAIADWLMEAFRGIFRDFPSVAGVVTRFGESDGCDVSGDFRSKLALRTSRQLRSFVSRLVPFFEEMDRTWVFRTWSVGVFSVGDLMWHKKRFAEVFNGFESPNLILSLKYGESDFFRYLPLNSNFFRTKHRKIVEFQARREYEGFGEFPSFVGWDCEHYLRELREAPGFCGAMVWSQTGGWGRFRRLTFVKNSSVWVELNVHVIARLCQGSSCKHAVDEFRGKHLPACSLDSLLSFLKLSEQAILKTLYVREFAEKKLFFRRLRMPPLFCVMWDRVIINHTIRRVARLFTDDWSGSIAEGEEGVVAVEQMISLARTAQLPLQGLELELDTLRLLALARHYFFDEFSDELAVRMQQAKQHYTAKHKNRYRVRMNFKPTRISKLQLRLVHLLLFRQKRRYRILDHVLALRLMPLLYPITAYLCRRAIPKFARKQAMGAEVLFR